MKYINCQARFAVDVAGVVAVRSVSACDPVALFKVMLTDGQKPQNIGEPDKLEMIISASILDGHSTLCVLQKKNVNTKLQFFSFL